MLLTHPMAAGYTQNPISIYYCYSAGGRLSMCVAEVTNTPWCVLPCRVFWLCFVVVLDESKNRRTESVQGREGDVLVRAGRTGDSEGAARLTPDGHERRLVCQRPWRRSAEGCQVACSNSAFLLRS